MRQVRTARDCALSLLEYRDRTEAEMRRKLKEWEYAPEAVEETIYFLKEYHYLDDQEYARKYVRTAGAGKSIRQLRQSLLSKGISREILDLCFEEETVDEEEAVRRFLKKKGYTAGAGEDPEKTRKLAAALGRRGFSFETIRRVMEELTDTVL